MVKISKKGRKGEVKGDDMSTKVQWEVIDGGKGVKKK